MSEHDSQHDHEVGAPDSRSASRTVHRWRRRAAIGAAVVAVIGIVTVLVLVANRDTEVGAPPAATTATTTVPAVSSTATTTSTVTTASAEPTRPTSDRPSAATTLAPFFGAVSTLDRQLHTAATAINGTGPPWRTISETVATTVRAADLGPVATAIPAGLPPDLLRSVILVYSDLASRRFAMGYFSIATTIHPNAHPNSTDLLHDLGTGHTAAARFPADLAATHTLAEATPAVTTLPETSRQAAEIQLYTRYVEEANGGCDTHGGHIITALPPITWNGRPGNGTIAGITFTANLTDGTWHIRLIAC